MQKDKPTLIDYYESMLELNFLLSKPLKQCMLYLINIKKIFLH